MGPDVLPLGVAKEIRHDLAALFAGAFAQRLLQLLSRDVAVGNTPNPMLLRATPDLERSDRGTVVADPETGLTSKPGVFAGGDIVTGGATVILAMGAGRRAARAIDEYLSG